MRHQNRILLTQHVFNMFLERGHFFGPAQFQVHGVGRNLDLRNGDIGQVFLQGLFHCIYVCASRATAEQRFPESIRDYRQKFSYYRISGSKTILFPTYQGSLL
jgi:hypothetical protein